MNFSEIFLNDGTLSVPLMLWLIYLAVVIGTVIYFTVNYQLGKIVSKLLEKEAFSPESAITVEDAEIKYGFFTKICLKSPANYKDLLVAITSDGRFYANMQYTDEAPKFKLLRAITRIKKSRIAESTPAQPDDISNPTETASQLSENTADIPENTDNQQKISQNPPAKVSFNTYTAKYYIPKEVHDKAKGIFKTSKVNVLVIIASLVLLGIVIYFAGFLAESLADSFSSMGK